jgi:hypothetical protein
MSEDGLLVIAVSVYPSVFVMVNRSDIFIELPRSIFHSELHWAWDLQIQSEAGIKITSAAAIAVILASILCNLWVITKVTLKHFLKDNIIQNNRSQRFESNLYTLDDL